MKILLACANSRSRPLEGADKEILALNDLFKAKNIQAVLNQAATLSGISQNMLDNPRNIAILHYSGHANAKAIELWEDAEQNLNKNAYADGLAQFVGAQNCVRVVFLNGCSSQGQINAFLKNGVKAVIATNKPVNDSIAESFARHFYTAWISGKSLGEAFTGALGLIKSGAATWEDLNRGVIFDDPENPVDLNSPTYTLYPAETSEAPVLKASLREILNGYNPPAKKKNIFVIHAQEDKAFHDSLYMQMKPMERKGLIGWNSADTLTFDSAVDDQYQLLMENADIILLLVSPFFMSSDFIFGSPLEVALQKHQSKECLLIPVIVLPVNYKTSSFGGLQVLPKNGVPVGKPDNHDALFEIQDAIKGLVEK
ncbi:MAG: CHAT domain-containing protein [Bacteroidia bacterium]|nr:CHAT domain-containing protein [Bacteroidia bacterium]